MSTTVHNWRTTKQSNFRNGRLTSVVELRKCTRCGCVQSRANLTTAIWQDGDRGTYSDFDARGRTERSRCEG